MSLNLGMVLAAVDALPTFVRTVKDVVNGVENVEDEKLEHDVKGIDWSLDQIKSVDISTLSHEDQLKINESVENLQAVNNFIQKSSKMIK